MRLIALHGICGFEERYSQNKFNSSLKSLRFSGTLTKCEFLFEVSAESQSMADFSKQVTDNEGIKIVFKTNYSESKAAVSLIAGRDCKD
jgi:hypothetical protein